MNLHSLINNRFSYIGLTIGLLVGGLLMSFIPGKWEGITVIEVGFNIDNVLKSRPFLTSAGMHSCAPGLAKSLDVKKSRNLKTYKMDDNYTKLRVIASSEKEVLCYSEAITDEIKSFLEKRLERERDILMIKIEILMKENLRGIHSPESASLTDLSKMAKVSKLAVLADRKDVASNVDLGEITDIADIADVVNNTDGSSSEIVNYIQKIKDYKEHMILFSKVSEYKAYYIKQVEMLGQKIIYPTEIDRYLPISWRLASLGLFGLLGLGLGILVWRNQQNSK